MKKVRYCGDVKIELEYLGFDEERDRFSVRVTVAGHVWQYDEFFVDPGPPGHRKADTADDAFDSAATVAVHYGSKYNIGWDLDDGCIPDWAPPRDIAQAINDAASVNDDGYVIGRSEPAVLPDGVVQ